MFWNGRTVKTSPIVTSPASIEARRPPPLAMAIWMPWSATRSSIASATRLPIEHSIARQTLRSPSTTSVVSPTTSTIISSIGPASSATRRSDGLVRRHARVEKHGVALGIEHLARVVETHLEMAEVFRIGIGLHDRHHHAVGVRDEGRIGPVAVGIVLAEVAVGMAAHDHVDAGHGLGDADVGGQAHMGQRDDDLDALLGQRVHVALQRVDLFLEDDGIAGRGNLHRVARERRDDADLACRSHRGRSHHPPARSAWGPGWTSRLPETDREADRIEQRQAGPRGRC